MVAKLVASGRVYYRLICFLFQAEDGIRHGHVTGVQTCALPILPTERREAHRTPAISGERGVEGDGRSGQRLAHRAVRLGSLCRLLELLGRQPGDGAAHSDEDPGDALTGLEGDVGGGLQSLGRIAALSQRVRQRHREARRVRGGDELLRTRAPGRLFCAGGPRDVEGAEARRFERHRPGAVHEGSSPFRGCFACCRHWRKPRSSSTEGGPQRHGRRTGRAPDQRVGRRGARARAIACRHRTLTGGARSPTSDRSLTRPMLGSAPPTAGPTGKRRGPRRRNGTAGGGCRAVPAVGGAPLLFQACGGSAAHTRSTTTSRPTTTASLDHFEAGGPYGTAFKPSRTGGNPCGTRGDG